MGTMFNGDVESLGEDSWQAQFVGALSPNVKLWRAAACGRAELLAKRDHMASTVRRPVSGVTSAVIRL